MRIVLDTNVLVSGLLSPHGASARILQLLLAQQVSLCVDARILAEYEAVLHRPRFELDLQHLATLMAFLEAEAIPVVPRPLPAGLPDPDDEPFLEVALAGTAAYLVTGNLRHYPVAARRGVRVVAPRAFLDIFRRLE